MQEFLERWVKRWAAPRHKGWPPTPHAISIISESSLSYFMHSTAFIKRCLRKFYEIFRISSLLSIFSFRQRSPRICLWRTLFFRYLWLVCVLMIEANQLVKNENSVSVSHATELICRYHVIGAQGELCRRRTTLIRNGSFAMCPTIWWHWVLGRVPADNDLAVLCAHKVLITRHREVDNKIINFECRKRMRTFIPSSRLSFRNEEGTPKKKL